MDAFLLKPDLLSVVLGLLVFQVQPQILLLQPAAEFAVEFVRFHPESLLDRLVQVVPQQDLAILPHEIADSFLAVLLGDEVEGGLTEAVGQKALDVHLVDGRDDVVDHRVPDHHLVEGALGVGHVLRQSLHEPQRRVGAQRASEGSFVEDGVLEDVSQLMGDELIEQIRGPVHGEDHAVLEGFREGAHVLGDKLQQDIRLLEFPMGLVKDEGNADLNLVVEGLRKLHVGALRVGDHLLQPTLLRGIVIDVEVG